MDQNTAPVRRPLSATERLVLRMAAATLATANQSLESRVVSRVLTAVNFCSEGDFASAAETLAEFAASK